MHNELSASSDRAARALCQSMVDRLTVDDVISGQEMYRSSRTLGTLVRALSEERFLAPYLVDSLDQLMIALAVRLGESIDGSEADDVFQLGRALDIVAGLRRQYRGQVAG